MPLAHNARFREHHQEFISCMLLRDGNGKQQVVENIRSLVGSMLAYFM